MLNEKKKVKFFDLIVDLIFIAFFTAHFLLPSFDLNFIIPLALALAYCVYFGIKDTKLGANLILVISACAFLALVYAVLTETKTISSDVDNAGLKQYVSKFNQYFMMFFPLLLSFRIIKTYPRKVRFRILIFIAAVFGYVFVNTFILLLTDPGAVRHWDEFSSLAGQDIGSYDFVYAVPIIICTLAACNKKFNLVGKIINVIVIVCAFVFLVNADYTLALLIAMIGLVLVGYLRCQRTLSKFTYILLCIIGAFFIPSILKLFYTYFPDGDISLRIREIYDFLVSGDSSGYNLNGRLTLYGESLLAFFRSPLVGNESLDFDGHGTFLTVLSDTGIIGAVFMYGIVFAARKYVKHILGAYDRSFMPVFIAFILMGIVNPIHATDALSFTMWCVAPLVLDYFFNLEESINETTVEN